ncbi:hypothetical protein R5R35_014230 [Gryllus longicercus]|uniref:Tyrosine-protein kinase receptor n=1 Tax=Gryllus longicercus TaxID=2509291 RepID=A0AAN9Z984_9ORTH
MARTTPTASPPSPPPRPSLASRCLALLVLALPLVLAAATSAGGALETLDFQEQCAQRCPFQNKTEEGDFDIGCGNECKIEQCAKGCMSWHKALEFQNTSCQSVCNGTQDPLPPKEFYCIMGCNDALNRYFQKLKDEIGTPPAPVLVADTLTDTSLSLEWEGMSKYSNISYLVQWRYEELAGAWQYCRNQTWGPHPTILVENLQPYTKYRFRIALLLSPHHSEPIVSEPSVVISTLPSGLPSTAPTIVRATAVDSSHISVSWVPGPFPNGPLLSYKLKISELPDRYTALKDIPASENTAFYLFRNLQANRNYSISLSMRNNVGEGPAAVTFVTTPSGPTVKDTQQPILILGAQHSVIQQGADIIYEPYTLYNTSYVITGMAIHVSRRMLFISESSGYVSRMSLSESSLSTILTPAHANFKPLDLSVDWLNDQLYILGEVAHTSGSKWQVARCGLDGRGLTIAMAGLLTRPTHIEVDPYNGYLFWVTQGTPRPGLYRLDLADISNGVKHEVQPKIMLEDPFLGAFTVDHTNFRLLVANHSQNTVLSVSLDGREVVDLRANTQQPMFQHVVSLAAANGLFFWTNGVEVYTEEYHAGRDSYYHNAYPDLSDRGFVSVCVNLSTSQPVPLPVNPPVGVQAILGTEVAKISWQVPHLVGGQGKGAWQNWSYTLLLKDEKRKLTVSANKINGTTYTARNILPDTTYIIKVAAYTTSGQGPWSSEFRGKTLRKSPRGQQSTVLWSAAEGLLKSDITGENVEILMHTPNLKDATGDHHITDMAWYKDLLYLVTNTTRVYWYNLTSHERGILHDLDSVGSIAVDWIGRKLYWSNPKQQLISRGNLNGSQQEPLILTVAKELHVDAVHSHIYWSTGHAVECAKLNGQDKQVYYPEEIFSGKQVMGLTLDPDRRLVYWIVRSYEGSLLFQAPTAEQFFPRHQDTSLKALPLQQHNIQGPLCYFSDHLLWLQDDRNAVVGDLNGQNTALINKLSLSGLHMATVVDTALQYFPDHIGESEVNVIPEAVDVNSIRIEGTWQAFFIKWNPITNVNYGQVFYELSINDPNMREIKPTTTNDTFVSYGDADKLEPHSPLHVTINAFTYWGASPQTRVMLHSPPSVPSAPTNPRVFIQYTRDPVDEYQNITAVFRWNPPTHPNGIIEGYKVECWFISLENNNQSCTNSPADTDKHEYIANNLLHHSTYYFQVQARTAVGSGALSFQVRANTAVEMPVPKLLLSTPDTVRIADCDKQQNQMLSRSTGPIDLASLSHEKRIFWLSELKELLSANIDGLQRKKLVSLNGTGLSIAADWIGRHLYWAEGDEKHSGSNVFRLDLSQPLHDRTHIQKIFHRPGFVQKLDVAPFISTLYWIEVNSKGNGYLMSSNLEGHGIQSFFSVGLLRKKRDAMFSSEDTCSCPESPVVGHAMAVDQTNPEAPKILWVHGQHQHISVADAHGCHCNILVHANNAGLPPTSLTADHRLVYWSNASEGRIYSVTKDFHGEDVASLVNSVTKVDVLGVQRITALGSHLQPYPVPHCLLPHQSPENLSLLHHSAHSVTLQLPAPQRPEECVNMSLASAQYIIYHSPQDEQIDCSSDPHLCTKTITFSKIMEIKNLRPFTNYKFYIAVKNYYSDLQGDIPQIGSPVVFRTGAGAPSPPRDVQVLVLTPTTVKVQWQPPEQFNDHAVSYELHWSTEGTVAGIRQKGEQIVGRHELYSISSDNEDDACSATLNKLLPGQNYSISVRAYSQSSGKFSESEPQGVRTFPEPDDIILINKTAYMISVSWTPLPDIALNGFEVQCVELSSRKTFGVTNNTQMSYSFFNLQPKHQYSFHLLLFYPLASEPYLWPSDERFIFETHGDKPSPPGVPVVQHLRRDVYQVTWEPSNDNGAHLELYSLEGRIQGEGRHRRETGTITASAENHTMELEPDPSYEWISYYNGTDNYWIIADLSSSSKYIFRVRSRNIYGWSEFSVPSASFDFTEAAMLAKEQELTVVLGISIPVGILVLCVMGMLTFIYALRRREKEKKILTSVVTGGTTRGPDVELATLRELPRRGNFVSQSNALYTMTPDVPGDAELALLPHIRRDQITLTKFLGSGAFGEVFEGIARNLAGMGDTETRVAIKTLRKGATEQEKAEFLKEAQLMSNFKHEHILQLLGVCLDNDPNFIIMELMESGDLLSYLRSSRPQIYMSSGLTLLDLVTMCVDVAKGCRYLEEMHFVHRDLACRNCLVSSGDPRTRVVKIGDFGLARDIYKNDYYRKEGEGLLPVRWMAPESLVDGVFTCQSDVWAFGVLIWEILTLGQQPYPARTNLEVLHYVRNGGRLSRPNNCPDQLHHLMLKTWSYNPENRPTFKYCLETLEDLKSKTAPIPLAAIQCGHYVSRTPNGGIDNQGFFEDENHNNSSGSSWKTGSDIESRDQVPFLQNAPEMHNAGQASTELRNTTDPPYYLELLYDSDTATTASDGYEIPKPLPTLPPMPPALADRLRTFSTSSTVSNASGSTSLSYQQVPLVCNRIDENETAELPTKINKELKGNGIIGGTCKTSDFRHNREKDLSMIEQLLINRRKCGSSVGENLHSHKINSTDISDSPTTYSNVSKHSGSESQVQASVSDDSASNCETVENTNGVINPIS